MSWKRLPSYLANLPLRLMPFTEQQQKAFDATGHVQEIALKTSPRVGKVGRTRFYAHKKAISAACMPAIQSGCMHARIPLQRQ